MADESGYAAIWDMDGTLVDTAELHFRAWAKAVGERGRPFSRDDFARTFGRRNPEIIHILFGEALVGPDAEGVGGSKKRYCTARRPSRGVELLQGVRHFA